MSSPDDERAKTHLSRLGVNPVTVAALQAEADRYNLPLRQIVQLALSAAVKA